MASASLLAVSENPDSPPFFLHQPPPFSVCDGRSARQGGFDLDPQPPLDTPLPKYNTQLWGRATSVTTEGEKPHLDGKADGQRVRRMTVSSGVRFLGECKQLAPQRGSPAFLQLLASHPWPLPPCQASLADSRASAPSTPAWGICPTPFLVVVFLLTCREPGPQSPQYDDLDECLLSARPKGLYNKNVPQTFEAGRRQDGYRGHVSMVT